MDEKEQNKQCKKELIYYEKTLEALINNNIELDRSILYLSSGAIALIIQIIASNKDILKCCCSKLLLAMSGAMFLLCIFGFFIILFINSKMLKSSLKEKEKENQISLARFWDWILRGVFVLGVLLFYIFILIYLWQ